MTVAWIATALAVAASGQDVGLRADSGTAVYRNDDNAIVVRPWAHITQRAGGPLSVGAGWRADLITAASVDLVTAFAGQAPLLGVCLGHQCIGEAFGGDVVSAGEIMHGKTSQITHDGRGVFAGLPNPFEAIRYHSLAIAPESVPAVLEVSARSESGVIMGVRHRAYAIEGVQFHPESIMTQHGHQLLQNFLNMRQPVTAK